MDSNQPTQQQASYQPMHAAPQPPKKRSNAPIVVVAILAIVAIAVAAFVIFSQNSGDDQKQQSGAETSQATDNPKGADADAGSYHVETADFEFDVPEYYQGKVEWESETIEGSGEMVKVYRKGHPDQDLFWVWTSTNSEDVEMEGDVATHVVDYIEKDGKYIGVTSTNWAYMTAYYVTEDTENSYTEEDLRALVDLSTGGRYTFEQVIKMGPEEVGVPDIDFCKANVVPTLKAK